MDVEMTLKKESDQQLQSIILINKMVEKRMKPILAKYQSLKAKMSKNSFGGHCAQASQPSACGPSKGKQSKPSDAKSTKQKVGKGNQTKKTPAN